MHTMNDGKRIGWKSEREREGAVPGHTHILHYVHCGTYDHILVHFCIYSYIFICLLRSRIL